MAIGFQEIGRSQYADRDDAAILSPCCGSDLHRPSGSMAGDCWFCRDCGIAYADTLPLVVSAGH